MIHLNLITAGRAERLRPPLTRDPIPASGTKSRDISLKAQDLRSPSGLIGERSVTRRGIDIRCVSFHPEKPQARYRRRIHSNGSA